MKTKNWLAFLGLSLAWGSSFLWIKIALEEVGPFTLVALRLFFGLAGLAVVAAIRRPAWPRGRQLWLALVVLGITNTALPFILISWGEVYIDSAVASILNSTVPLFTALIAHLFLSDDRLTRLRIVGMLIGFGGVVTVLSRDTGGGLEANLLGQAAVLLASLLYAFSAVFARRNTKGISPLVQSIVPLAVADSIVWAGTALVEAPVRMPELPITWGALLWLGLIGSCLAYLLYFYLLHAIGPTRATMVTYTFPVIGVALGVAFLGEVLDWQLGLGGALVVASIVIVNRKEPK